MTTLLTTKPTVNQRALIQASINSFGASLAGEIKSPVYNTDFSAFYASRAVTAYNAAEKVLLESIRRNSTATVIDEVNNILTTGAALLLNPEIKEEVVDNMIKRAFDMGDAIERELIARTVIWDLL